MESHSAVLTPDAAEDNRHWYVYEAEETFGPFSYPQMLRLELEGRVAAHSLTALVGSDGWLAWSEYRPTQMQTQSAPLIETPTFTAPETAPSAFVPHFNTQPATQDFTAMRAENKPSEGKSKKGAKAQKVKAEKVKPEKVKKEKAMKAASEVAEGAGSAKALPFPPLALILALLGVIAMIATVLTSALPLAGVGLLAIIGAVVVTLKAKQGSAQA
jgi:hypothetical protein